MRPFPKAITISDRAAATELSTPPDMATTTRVAAGGLSNPRLFMARIWEPGPPAQRRPGRGLRRRRARP